MALIASTVIARHGVSVLPDGLSPMQDSMLKSRSLFTIVDAPTGSGKSYVFQKAVLRGERVLFLVPTKRLGENQARSLRDALCDPVRAAQEGRTPWSRDLAEQKIQCWNSNFTDELKERGYENTRAYYAGRLSSLNPAEGGEIVFATPELINSHFIRPRLDGKFSDIGPWTVCLHFDRIVYDEFHLIEERGFGIIAIIASVAKLWEKKDGISRRGRIYLLSATPKEVAGVLAKLGFDTNDPDEVRLISEDLIEDGERSLHGDVTVEFHEGCALIDILRSDSALVDRRDDERIVVLYDSVRSLRDEEEELKEFFASLGVKDLHIDSGQHNQIESAYSGRSRQIENYRVVVGTSTLEVGITIPKVTRMVMNPGMNPLSMIQRIGRAARGDLDGRVVIAIDRIASKPWLHRFVELVHAMGERTTIQTFLAAAVEVSSVGERLEVGNPEAPSSITFGKMGSRAVWASALYHLMLEHRLRDQKIGSFAKRISDASPALSGALRDRLRTVEKFVGGRRWRTAFFAEAENLRSFAPTIKVAITGQDNILTYSESWIRRHTHILDQCPVEIDERGQPFVRCAQAQWDRLKSGARAPSALRRGVVLPDATLASVGLNEVTDYLDLLERPGTEKRRREAFKAAGDLVRYTGIVPFSDAEIIDVDANSGIL